MMKPSVYLIGAGPGDPGLITVHGLECLRRADVVIYDRLVSPRLLRYARHTAELIDVGIAAPQPMEQEAISYLLAEKAREGKVVARLKWGDPFVFDRGGEEALFLRQQGIVFEVVPGVPAGIAVPAYAGVPVSYPGDGDTITLVRGYEGESRTPPTIDWAGLVRLDGTVVCYAGAQQLPLILDSLQEHGWPPDGQAVAVYHGTLPAQQTLAGTLAELREMTKDKRGRGPAMLIVGRVAGRRKHLRWYDSRPLFGIRVLVTRSREQATELADLLTGLGAEPVVAPMIRIVPPEDREPLLRAASTVNTFDWVVFTSTNAVDALMQAVLETGGDVRSLKGPLLCAVGSATAEQLARYGIKVDLVPSEYRAEALASALAAQGSLDEVRVLLPRADIGREVVADSLRAGGALVTEVVAYRNVLNEATEGGPDIYRMLLDNELHVVTFTSASAVRNFAKLYGAEQAADLLSRTVVAAIGPVTADAAARLGIPVHVQPSTYTVPALVDAIVRHVAAAKAAPGASRGSA
jgi:uroporphyrinogen III methyltransferase/synthase